MPKFNITTTEVITKVYTLEDIEADDAEAAQKEAEESIEEGTISEDSEDTSYTHVTTEA